MAEFNLNGFSELTPENCNDVNGGFALTIAGFTITGVTVAKWAAGFVISQGIKHTWKRIHGQYD